MYISKYDLNGGNLIIKRIAWRCFLCVICFLFICNKHVSIFYLFLICNISFKNSPLIKIPEVTKEYAVIRKECHLNYYLTQLYIYFVQVIIYQLEIRAFRFSVEKFLLFLSFYYHYTRQFFNSNIFQNWKGYWFNYATVLQPIYQSMECKVLDFWFRYFRNLQGKIKQTQYFVYFKC